MATRMRRGPESRRSPRRFPARGAAIAALAMWLVACGCSELDRHATFPWLADKDDAVTPKTVTAMWTDTVMHQPDQAGMRGFGGRLHFFGEDENKAVKVDGTLTVYAFDGDDVSGAVKPEKKYIFLPDQISSHESDSSLGPSYSFWLPWDAVGGPQRKFSLIARFESRDGGVVLSPPTRIVLPGVEAGPPQEPLATARVQAQARTYETRTVSAEQPVGEPARAETPAKMSSFTIDVPTQFLRRTQRTAAETPSNEGAASDNKNAAGATAAPPAKASPTSASPPAVTASAPVSGAAPTALAAEPPEQVIAPPARFVQQRFPAQTAPGLRPSHDRVRRQPYRGAWPSRLPPTPRSDLPTAEFPSAEAAAAAVR